MKDREIKQIIKNCDQRIRSAKKLYKQAVSEHCVYTQNQALAAIEQNEKLKRRCLDRLDV